MVITQGATFNMPEGVDYSFPKTQAKTVLAFKDVIQSTILLMIPFVIQLPAGVFFYWIPSHATGFAVSFLLKRKE
eukprot:gene30582-34711_t